MLDAVGRLQPLEGVFANAHYSGGRFVRVLPHWQRPRPDSLVDLRSN